MSATVENLGDTAEAFLPSSVPNLQLQHFVLHLDEVRAELHSDCDIVVVMEVVINEPLQNARLANTRITNDNDLEECIELCLRAVNDLFIAQGSYLLQIIVLIVFSCFD